MQYYNSSSIEQMGGALNGIFVCLKTLLQICKQTKNWTQKIQN